jgi:hypothetical protein
MRKRLTILIISLSTLTYGQSSKREKHKDLIDFSYSAINLNPDTVKNLDNKLTTGIINKKDAKDDLITVDIILLSCCYYGGNIEIVDNKLILQYTEAVKTPGCSRTGVYRLKYRVKHADTFDKVEVVKK